MGHVINNSSTNVSFYLMTWLYRRVIGYFFNKRDMIFHMMYIKTTSFNLVIGHQALIESRCWYSIFKASSANFRFYESSHRYAEKITPPPPNCIHVDTFINDLWKGSKIRLKTIIPIISWTKRLQQIYTNSLQFRIYKRGTLER